MPEETPNAEQPAEQPEANGGGGTPAGAGEGEGNVDGGNTTPNAADAGGTEPAPAPTGEGESGGVATGGTGSESNPEPEAAEGSGQEIPESAGGAEAAPETTPATEEVKGEPPTQPAAGLPSEPASNESDPAGSPEDDKTVVEELTELGGEALDKAKEIGRATLKDAINESRAYISTLLNNKDMSEDEKLEIARLYRAAEKHALMGKVAVAHAMGKRLDNFVKSSSKVHKSEKARASQNYLTGLLRLATGAVSTFFGAFGKPLVDKLSDIGLKATDEFLQ